MYTIFYSFFTALTVSIFTIPVLRWLAYRYDIVDHPNTALKQHTAPTAYLGGVAVYFGYLIATLVWAPMSYSLSCLLIGASLFLLLGLYDDLYPTTPYQKFFAQFLFASGLLAAGFVVNEPYLPPLLNYVFSFVWIVGIANAFNLIDIMDGLATTVAVCATGSLLVFSLLAGQHAVSLVLAAFLGGLIAFLRVNLPPARMYLGDAGALFIGSFLALVSLVIPWKAYAPLGNLIPVVLLGISILEVGSLVVIRLYKKIPFYYGSRDHFAHYLFAHGWTKNGILGLVLVISLLFAGVAYLIFCNTVSFGMLLGLGLAFLVIWIMLIRGVLYSKGL